jgi:hypothetical protein
MRGKPVARICGPRFGHQVNAVVKACRRSCGPGAVMIIISVGCLIFGSLLGMRFRVTFFCLPRWPSELPCCPSRFLDGQSASQIVASQILALAALQSGFLLTGFNRSLRNLYQHDAPVASQFSLTEFWRRWADARRFLSQVCLAATRKCFIAAIVMTR